ncbi:hypothetical protein D3C73_963980 [compost metagenome]
MRIETLNTIQSYILHTVHKHGPELDTLIIEEVLMSTHCIQQELQIVLIYVRLEKGLLSHKDSKPGEFEIEKTLPDAD